MNNITKIIFEIGVGEAYTSRTSCFWGNPNVECHLFEPNPKIYNELKSATQNFSNVKLYNLAISDKQGEAELYLANNCSFIDGIDSPIAVQDGTKNEYKKWDKTLVQLDTIDNYDNGNIDLLLLDMEGSEWFVLERLKSRPTQIIVETHISTNTPPYLNKYMNKILFWMWENNYQLIMKKGNDSFFKKINE